MEQEPQEQPVPSVQPEQPAQPESRREPVVFSGTGAEYFRIWIVNLCLSIITLGIYSAWAKVRRLKYFYQHTSVAGANFDFHGNPLAILKGRIIAVILFGLYAAAGEAYRIHPILLLLGPLIFLLIMSIMPWLVVRSLRFRLGNTSHRGLRFSFHGKTGEAYIYFMLMPLASVFTMYLLWPLAKQLICKYVATNSEYGNERFGFHAGAGDFYPPYLIAFAGFIGIMVLAIILMAIILGIGVGLGGSDSPMAAVASVMAVVVIFAGYIGGLLLIYPFLTARLQNIIWSNTTVGPVAFESHVRARRLAWIMFSNIALILVTFGLYKPFADIRFARYRLESGTMLVHGDIDQFVAGAQTTAGAAGEEIADIFDFDISL